MLSSISLSTPYISLIHSQMSAFDTGVRHWLYQLTAAFGEDAALAGIRSIATAQNLPGVRCGASYLGYKE